MNRLPDVELLTAGGRGVPMLAASYATERNLSLTALVADFRRFPVDADKRRDAHRVADTDAAQIQEIHILKSNRLVKRIGASCTQRYTES